MVPVTAAISAQKKLLHKQKGIHWTGNLEVYGK